MPSIKVAVTKYPNIVLAQIVANFTEVFSYFDDTQKRVQNQGKHIRMKLFTKIVNGSQLLTSFPKSSVLDV